MSFVQDTWDDIRGKTAADASREGSQVAAEGQREALEYLKEKEAMPMQFRNEALPQLAGLFGIGDQSGQAFEQLQQSPMYQAVMGQKADALQEGESAILRNASATGGLRSGNTNDALARYAGNLDSRLQTQALQQSMSGLQGLAGQQGNTQAIANTMAGIGQTLGMGITAEGQARTDGWGNILSAGSGAAAGFAASDARLKANVKSEGERHGYNWYSWDWSEEAESIGLSGRSEGVMAHEVAQTNPEAVQAKDGYLMVNYEKLGVAQ